MRKTVIAAIPLYLFALPGLVIITLTSPGWIMPIIPVVVTLVAIHIGLALAPRVGFRSLTLDKMSGRPVAGLGSSAVIAAAGAIAIGLPWVVLARTLINAGLVEESVAFAEPSTIVPALFTGGVLEELIFRWCGMSLGVFLLRKVLSRDPENPGVLLHWVALVVTSALFSVSHLPHIWDLGQSAMSPFGLLQLGLSLIAGLIIGWIFWKRGLEFAIATHAFGIVVIWLFS